MSGTGRRRGEPAEEYVADQFAFVDDENAADVVDWLSFSETRSERREERRRRLRFRGIVIGVVLVVLLAAAGGVLAWRGMGGKAAVTAQRASVLVQIRDTTGSAVGSALLVADPANHAGVTVLVPANLRVDVTGQGLEPFGDVTKLVGPGTSRDALAELLGIRIDGSWMLDPVTFSSLVDELGGLDMSVKSPVKDGGRVLVPAGNARLDGAQALSFLSPPGGGSTDAQQRFAQVLNALLGKMPNNPLTARDVLGGIGMIPDPSMDNTRLGAVLATLGSAVTQRRLTSRTLPVDAQDGSLDMAAAGPLVTQVLGGSVRQGRTDGPTRVLVQDASGRDGAGEASRIKLVDAGYVFLVGPTRRPSLARTAVEVSSADGRADGVQVALTLGLDPSAVRVDPAARNLADVTVLLGRDFSFTSPPDAASGASPSASAGAAGRRSATATPSTGGQPRSPR